MNIKFAVPGIPAPGGSKRGFIVNGRVNIVDDAKRNAPWRSMVSLAASNAMAGKPPMTGPLSLIVTFNMQRPKSHYRSNGELKPVAPQWHTIKPDATKLLRAVEDAMTGIVWVDDAQVCIQSVIKQYGAEPGARITITAGGQDDAGNGSPAPARMKVKV